MTQYAFGQTIPVTGPNIGFPGAVSRFGERVIVARQFMPTNVTNVLNFGDPAVQIPNAQGGVYTSVADYVAAATANIANVAAYFAGMAVREVKTQLVYPNAVTPGVQQLGNYNNLQIAEVMERGSGTINLAVGTPNAGAQIYTRVVLNTAVTAGTIGDYETNPAATDLFTLTGATAAAAGATAITLTGTNVFVGQPVSGPGVQPGTYVVSGTGTAGAYTAIVLSQALTTAITATSPLTFSNLVALPNMVARTGYVDSNNVLEITIKIRNAA
jgi:hypothetical protein